MKRFSLIAALFLALAMSAPAQSTKNLFSAKAFATATSRTDTSGTEKVTQYPYISLTTYYVGSDSLTLYTYVDAKFGSYWLTMTRDTIKVGPAITSTEKARVITLRNASTDLLGGATDFRVRNVLRPFRTADSTSATSYTQFLVLRKAGN